MLNAGRPICSHTLRFEISLVLMTPISMDIAQPDVDSKTVDQWSPKRILSVDIGGSNVKILNEANRQHFDGNGYFIREGIVVIPKNGVIDDGTVV